MRRTLGLLLGTLVTCAHAQTKDDLAPFMVVENVPQAILLNGPIDPRSPLAFRRALEANPKAEVLVLNSVGGAVQSALLIAEEVHARSMSTLILEESECLSACSLIFFAGKQRATFGKLGVHQMSGADDLKAAQLNLSDILQSLEKYQVDNAVILRMLRTPPAEMYVFSHDEVTELGINRLLERQGEAAPVPFSKQTEAAPNELAKAFVLGVIASGSLKSSELVSMSNQVYAEAVTFYGKAMTKTQVLADKIQYASRWPVRSSVARPATVVATCSQFRCRVTGVYDWRVSDPKRRKSLRGSAMFDYEVEMAPKMRIIAENGEVLYRALGD